MASLENKTFLLIPGAQKAGTSWIFNVLRTHPQVALSPIKELHFWGRRDGPGWAEKRFERKLRTDTYKGKAYTDALHERLAMNGQVDRYRTYFETRTGTAKVYGEITPAYSILPLSEWREIARSFPDMKLVFLLRDPVARFWSQLKFDNPDMSVADLAKAVAPALTKGGYKKRSDYQRTITHLEATLPRDRILYLFQETLSERKSLMSLTDFLGLDPITSLPDSASNVGPNRPLPPQIEQVLRAALAPQYDFCQEKFGKNLPRAWLP